MENDYLTKDDIVSLQATADRLNAFLDIYYRTHLIDQDIFQNPVTFNNGIKLYNINTVSKISTGTTGTEIGISPSEKLAFYGAAPVVQQSAITPPAGGAVIDVQARVAINTIITRFQTLGLTA